MKAIIWDDEMLGAERLSARILRRRIENQGKLGAVLDIVFDQPERETLTEDECMTVTTLHFFNVVVTGLSAAQELTASKCHLNATSQLLTRR